MPKGHKINCKCMICKRKNSYSIYKNKNWLTEQYWGFDLSVFQIAKLVNVSGTIIHYWMKKYNIPLKKSSLKGKSLEEIGHKLDCNCSFCKIKRGDISWLTKEIRLKRNKSIKESLNSINGKQNLSDAQKKRYEDPLEREKTGETTKETWKNLEIRKKRISGLKEVQSKPEYIEKISKLTKERWKDPIYKDRVVRATARANSITIGSKLEDYVKEVLNKLYSNHWVHNNKQTFKVISGKIPDFYHVSLPVVIEINGDYWHSKKMTGVDTDIHEQQQIEHYKKYGYDCIVFWEFEVKGMNFEHLVVERLSQLYLKFEDVEGLFNGRQTQLKEWL